MITGFTVDMSNMRIDDIDNAISSYETEIAGLPEWKKSEAPPYLYMTMEDLKKKSPDELAEAVIELRRYALYLDRIINKNRSWERWAKSKLDEHTANALENISSRYGFNERIIIAKNKPEVCQKLNAFLREIGMKLERLYGVPDNVRAIADSIRELKFINLKREREYERS